MVFGVGSARIIIRTVRKAGSKVVLRVSGRIRKNRSIAESMLAADGDGVSVVA